MLHFAATIGFFDGVHLGHQYLLNRLRQVAKQSNLQSAVVTFNCHPLSLLKGEKKPLLTTAEERLHLLKQQQLNEVFCFNFSVIKDFTASEFLSVLHNQCNVDVLLMGYDHRFGADCLSSRAGYEQAAAEAGIKLVWTDEYITHGEHISSTCIRSLILEGKIEKTNELLGYQFSLSGEIVHGSQIGRLLGFPTANIAVAENKLLPINGVYAVEVETDDSSVYQGLLNIGIKPTIGANSRTVEVHILDFEGDLYGKMLTIRFCRFLRKEKRFSSLEELKLQIANDLKCI